MANLAIGLAASFALSTVSSLLRPRRTVEQGKADPSIGAVSSYGRGIPYLYGTVPVRGNIIWADQIQEVRNEDDGGKKGKKKGAPTVVTYSYFATFAVLIGDGPLSAVRRVWFNNKLVVDLSETAVNSWKYGRETYRIYLGRDDQGPDPTIEAVEGVGQTPAYRGRAYMVCRGLPLQDFGNALPHDIRFEVLAVSGDPAALPKTELPITGQFAPNEDVWAVDPLRPVIWMHDGESVVHRLNARTGAPLGSLAYRDDPLVDLWWNDVAASPAQGQIGGILDVTGSPQLALHDPSGDVFVLTNKVSRTGVVWLDGDSLEPKGLIYFGIATLASGLGVGGEHMLFYAIDGTFWLVKLYESGFTQFVLEEHPGPGAGIQDVAADGSANVAYLLANPGGIPTVTRLNADGDVLTVAVGSDPNWAGTGSAHLITYDALTGTVIVATADAVHKLDASSLLVLDSAAVISIGHGHIAVVQRTVNGAFWLRGSGQTVIEIATADFAELSVADIGAFGHTIGDTFWIDPRDRSAVDAHPASSPELWSNNLWRLHLTLKAQTPTTLDRVVSDLCTRVGLSTSEIDVTDLAVVEVQGYRVSEPQSARDAIDALRQIYHFDATESDGTLAFRQRASATTLLTIPPENLAARTEDQNAPELIERRLQKIELPLSITVGYFDPTNDYNLAVQRAQRSPDAVRSVNKQELTVDLVLTHAEAATVAWRLLAETWRERDAKEFLLPPRYLALEPTDVVRLTRTSATGLTSDFLIRIVEVELGAAYVLKVRGVLHDDAVFELARPAAPTESPLLATIPFAVPTRLVFANAPALDSVDDDGGYWLGTGPAFDVGDDTSWPGAAVFRSADDLNYVPVANLARAATFGRLMSELPSTDRWTVWDRTSTLQVHLWSGGFADATEQEVLAGDRNLLLVGDEVIGFSTAVDDAARPGFWTLSDLLRGRYGTERAVGTHVMRERVVLLDRRTSLARVGSLDGKDIAATFRGATFGTPLTEAAAFGFTNTARALLPWSPCDVRVSFAGADATITWKRRTRYGGQWRDGGVVPLNESSEAYEVRILRGDRATAVATLNVTSPAASWSDYDASFDLGSTIAIGTNLDFETGDLTGWTATSTAGGAIVTTSLDGLTASEGSYFVTGDTADPDEIYQDLLLDAVSPGKIAAGHYDFQLDWQQANAAASDLGRVIVEFRDIDGNVVSSLATAFEEITPQDTWVARSLSSTLPPTTAAIRVRLLWERASGATSNAAFDAFAATLTDRFPGERKLLVLVAQISAAVGAGVARIGGAA